MDLEITLRCNVCDNELASYQNRHGEIVVTRCDCSDDEIYKEGYDAGIADASE